MQPAFAWPAMTWQRTTTDMTDFWSQRHFRPTEETFCTAPEQIALYVLFVLCQRFRDSHNWVALWSGMDEKREICLFYPLKGSVSHEVIFKQITEPNGKGQFWLDNCNLYKKVTDFLSTIRNVAIGAGVMHNWSWSHGRIFPIKGRPCWRKGQVAMMSTFSFTVIPDWRRCRSTPFGKWGDVAV